MKVVIIDNYDSFTYNLVQYFQEIVGSKVDVVRNDKFLIDELLPYDLIVISPGPGLPEEAGRTMEVIKKYAGTKPIFGVCLGLQSIVECYGGKLHNLTSVMHGVDSGIEKVGDDPFFEGINMQECRIGRYHSWVADRTTFPSDELDIIATDEKGEIMAIRHKEKFVVAVQYHPESILTPDGKQMLRNLINQVRKSL